MEATWPCAALHRVGPWVVRCGAGGGKRVSATTAEPGWSDADIPLACAAMDDLHQQRLFLIRQGDAALDTALAARGYRVVDPVSVYAARLASLGPAPAAMTTFPHWPPLGIAAAIWADGGIGAPRLAVMDRVAGPKAAVLGRQNDRAAGVAFVAVHGAVAMFHAVEVAPDLRRLGVARNLLRRTAHWAQAEGADWLALAVTEANGPARALYASLGMRVVEQYHYRLT